MRFWSLFSTQWNDNSYIPYMWITQKNEKKNLYILTLCKIPSFKPDFLRNAAASEAPIWPVLETSACQKIKVCLCNQSLVLLSRPSPRKKKCIKFNNTIKLLYKGPQVYLSFKLTFKVEFPGENFWQNMFAAVRGFILTEKTQGKEVYKIQTLLVESKLRYV